MAKDFLSLEDVCKDLQLTADQVKNLVKNGVLRGFLDQKSYKFRQADVDAYKARVEESVTVVASGEPRGEELTDTDLSDLASDSEDEKVPDTGKVDLANIDSDPGADESDQTSVLAAAEAGDEGAPREESPVFEFSETDLGLSLDEEPALEEADQTSLLAPAEGGEEKEDSPVFEFDTDSELGAPGKRADSVLVADESESSLDILEVADESSSDTGSSGSELAVVEESSSGEDVAAEVEDASDEVVSAVPSTVGASDSDTVADILSEVEEGSDEALETLELDEIMAPPEEGVPEEALEAAEVATAEAPQTETAETIPLSDEIETVGIEEEEGTKFAEGALEEEEMEAAEEEEIEPAAEEVEEAPIVAGGWEIVSPSALGNVFLIAALVMLVFGSVFVFCEMNDISNNFTKSVVEFVGSYIK